MMHVIIGLMNSGKTLFMTHQGYIDYKKGRKIISNYELNYPHELITKEQVIALGKEQPDLYNTTFLFDEFWIWFDSRKSHDNTIATNLLLQSSKQDTRIFMTSQDNMQNDVRVRKNTHFYTTVERVIKLGNAFRKIDEGERILDKSIQDKLYIKYKTYGMKIVGYTRMPYLKQSGLIKASEIFRLYDTHQKIKSD